MFGWALGYVQSLAELGALDEAQQLFAAVNLRWPQEGCRQRHAQWKSCRPWEVAKTGAVLKFWRGQREEGLRELRAIQAARWDRGNLVLGTLESEAGNDLEAIEALRRFELSTVWMPDYALGDLPGSMFLRARSLERLGRIDEARATIERMLLWWKRADPDIPLLSEAKTLAKRVGAKVP
jgi:tetratricopeptide (TPR) repeat protein